MFKYKLGYKASTKHAKRTKKKKKYLQEEDQPKRNAFNLDLKRDIALRFSSPSTSVGFSNVRMSRNF